VTKAKEDPWADFPDAMQLRAGAVPAGMPEGQAASAVPAAAKSIPAPANDPFAEFPDAPTTDTPAEAPLNDAGAYEDVQAPASALSDEDKAQLLHILRTGTAADARKFAASKGFGGKDNFDEVIANRDKGRGINPNLQYDIPKMPEQNTTGGALGRGIADIPTFGLLDELGSVVDTLGGTGGRENVFNSDNSLGQILSHNIDINRGIIQGDEAEHPVARLTGQLLGGLVIPTGMEGVGLKAGAAALREGASMQEARAIAATAVRNRLIATRRGDRGGIWRGSSEGGIAERAEGAAVGAATGAAGGAALGVAGEALAPRLPLVLLLLARLLKARRLRSGRRRSGRA
jgi:hypothetical protein